MSFIRDFIVYGIFGAGEGREEITVNDDDLPLPEHRVSHPPAASVEELFETHLPTAQKGRRVEDPKGAKGAPATIQDYQAATGIKGAFERPPSDAHSSSFLEAVREFGTGNSSRASVGTKRGRSQDTTTAAASPKAKSGSRAASTGHPNGEPSEEWTVKQLKDFAAENDIDIGRKSRKVDMLDTILEAAQLNASM